jgi:hypothetical protein
MKTNPTKQPLKVVAKEQGVAKGAVKQMVIDKVISYELVDGYYYVDADEVREALRDRVKKEKRVTIFTVNMKNSTTIIADLQTLASYGETALQGLGSFDGPLQMAEIAKKNGFVIDKGAIISEDLAPRFYVEMRAGTASESSIGAMELQNAVYARITQDWAIWISQARNQGIEIGFHLMDLYLASTCMASVK